LLGSEYGWSKHDILCDVYFDELYWLTRQIERRKLTEYRMQLAIVQNPHVKDPKELWRVLNSQDASQITRTEKFDDVGFEVLKSRLRASPRFVVK